jgi:DivIVA domain-containing protein
MDVTPHELRTAEFREEFRGYRQKEVDTLLDRAAVTIEQLQVELRRLSDHLNEARGGAPGDREQDDLLRRTLLLAQKAADDAVAEAQATAQSLVADAESRRAALLDSAQAQARSTIDSADEHATTTTTDAEARARALVDDATSRSNDIQRDAEARRDAMIADAEHQATTRGEAIRNRLQAECDVLESHRQALSADVDALERFVSGHRERLRSAVQSELAMVDALPELNLPEAPGPTAAATRPSLATLDLPNPPASFAGSPVASARAESAASGSAGDTIDLASPGDPEEILAPPMTSGPEPDMRRGRPGWGRPVTVETEEEATAGIAAEAGAAAPDAMATAAHVLDGDAEADDGEAAFTPSRAEDDDQEPLPRRPVGAPALFTPGQWLPSSRLDDAGNPIPAAEADDGYEEDAEDASWGAPTEALLVLDDSTEVPAVAAASDDARPDDARSGDDRPGDDRPDVDEIDLDRERDLDEVAARLREWRTSGRSSAWREDDDDHLPGIDDPYLAELREAVRDTAPLGPREHDEHDLDDDDHSDKPRSGIFRRRR